MALIRVTNVIVLDNPSVFTDLFRLDITFECLGPLKEDLEWKLVYVGSSSSAEYDQVLEELVVGPVPVGIHRFVLEANPPVVEQIPSQERLGVTLLLLVGSYRQDEFIRIGYYVYNEARETDMVISWDRVKRTTLSDTPRVTRFTIPWNTPDVVEQDDQDDCEEEEENSTSRALIVSFEKETSPFMERKRVSL